MPATFSPDCMAVCIPPDQNETFTADEIIALDEEGTDIVSETECLLPPVKNGHRLLTTLPEAFDGDGALFSGKSSVGAPLSVIQESEDYDSGDDHDDIRFHNQVCDGVVSTHSPDENDEQFAISGYVKTVPEDAEHDSETAMLFRELLQLGPGEHVEFSGTESQYLFQHFDAENLEYEEAAVVRPKFIGHYLLGDCLGEGSYAKVKEALNTETLERAAVKIFSPVKLKRIPNGMQNVNKEVNILRKLSHPNVCRMKEVLKKELKKKIYLVMDYAVCAISDLTRSLPQERLQAWKAHYYFLQVLDGLQYCHSRGVIHKDLKPSNLVITTKDTLKIIDFGVAEQLSPYSPNDLIGSSQGCPAVQPPQVADGTELFSGIKLDVWSCGVTFFSLCAGNSRFPFVGETVYELFANISERPHEMSEELKKEEPEFCSLIDAMLEKKEINRPYLDELRRHPWVRRHWPQPPAGTQSQEIISKALLRSTDSFLPYIQAYFHSSVRTSRAGSICCITGGRMPHHHHHYPRCHSHHLTPHNSVRGTCRQGSERRRSSVESRQHTHNTPSILTPRDLDSPAVEKAQELPEERHSHNQVNADQGCFSFKKWKICRVS